MQQKNYSYENYLRDAKEFLNLNINEKSNEIIQRLQVGNAYGIGLAPVIYLIDYSTNKYIYVDESCLGLFGITAKQWKEEGIEAFLEKWHPEDFKIMNNIIFPENIHFLKNLPLDCYPNIIFSSNYRVLTPKGNYISILQRSSFIPSEILGRPLGSLGVAFDITHFKNDISIVHTIEEIKETTNAINTEILYKRIYAIEENHKLLISRREREILKMMAEGLCSKEIAHHLNLSLHTINNHRKNMLSKTRCQSSTALLKYAYKRGYL